MNLSYPLSVALPLPTSSMAGLMSSTTTLDTSENGDLKCVAEAEAEDVDGEEVEEEVELEVVEVEVEVDVGVVDGSAALLGKKSGDLRMASTHLNAMSPILC